MRRLSFYSVLLVLCAAIIAINENQPQPQPMPGYPCTVLSISQQPLIRTTGDSEDPSGPTEYNLEVEDDLGYVWLAVGVGDEFYTNLHVGDKVQVVHENSPGRLYVVIIGRTP